MKKILIAFAAILGLAACQTTGTAQPDLAATVAKVCPPVRAALLVLRTSPAADPDMQETLNYVGPYVDLACTADLPASLADLHALADKALPLVIESVAKSKLPDDQKQTAILSLAVAQAVIGSLR